MSPAEWLADSEVAQTAPVRRTFVLPGEPIVDVRAYLASGVGAGCVQRCSCVPKRRSR